MVALIEFLGWKRDSTNTWRSGWLMPPDRDGMRLPSDIPPLTLDLMHEAVRYLRYKAGDQFQWLEYSRRLFEVIWGRRGNSEDCVLDSTAWDLIEATKEQRLEALLKTIGQWKEEESAVLA